MRYGASMPRGLPRTSWSWVRKANDLEASAIDAVVIVTSNVFLEVTSTESSPVSCSLATPRPTCHGAIRGSHADFAKLYTLVYNSMAASALRLLDQFSAVAVNPF